MRPRRRRTDRARGAVSRETDATRAAGRRCTKRHDNGTGRGRRGRVAHTTSPPTESATTDAMGDSGSPIGSASNSTSPPPPPAATRLRFRVDQVIVHVAVRAAERVLPLPVDGVAF